MPIAFLISTALAFWLVVPLTASAKEHRSAWVKHEFQLTHPCPATGVTSGTARIALVFVGLHVEGGLWLRATGRDASVLTGRYRG